MTTALVPVKGLDAGKSRLGAGLSRERLRDLCLTMLEDVVQALRASPELDRVVVVTPDAEVARRARHAGAQALERPDTGLNPALEAATRALAPGPGEALLVVLGDLPGVSPADVAALFDALAALGGRGAVWAPAADGGTAALLRAPAEAMPTRFGPDSAARHRHAAEAAGIPWRSLPRPGLHLDLDRPEDLEAFAAASPGTGGPRTRALLARWAREDLGASA